MNKSIHTYIAREFFITFRMNYLPTRVAHATNISHCNVSHCWPNRITQSPCTSCTHVERGFILISNTKFIFDVSMKENILHNSLINKIVPLKTAFIFFIAETWKGLGIFLKYSFRLKNISKRKENQEDCSCCAHSLMKNSASYSSVILMRRNAGDKRTWSDKGKVTRELCMESVSVTFALRTMTLTRCINIWRYYGIEYSIRLPKWD